MLAEVSNPSGTILRRYVPGPGVDEPLVWYEGSGTADRRWLHADERGSVIAVSDGSGAMLSINRYDEYGIPQSTNAGRFQYTGQAWLPELGMYTYKARMYSPTLGRFMQTDPIGYGDGLNWYNYVGGDPVNATDPSGLALDKQCIGTRLCKRDGSGGGAPTGSIPGPSGGGERSGTRFTFTTTYPDGTKSSWSYDANWPSSGSGGSAGFANPISSGGAGAMPGDIVVEATRKRKSIIIPSQPTSSSDCIPLSAGPVIFEGPSMEAVVGLGGGVSWLHFNIPSTGDSGWVISTSKSAGAGAFFGVQGGSYTSLGSLLGTSYGVSIPTGFARLGAGASGNSSGGGGSLAIGPGLGAYASKSETEILSSSRPICKN